ncbi:MAG: endonuclease domain-containing protein [Actinomycetota bacterium]|nr:endonuclease domain-containing protein [Actinomycetota bacterium]
MKNGLLRRRAARQEGIVAVWQLRGDGLTRAAVRHQVRGLRELHDGVYVTGDAPVTRRQHWWAAALTAPGRVVSHASAGAAHGFRPWVGPFEVVTGVGTGGPRRLPALLICRSATLPGNTTELHGLPITTAERALADLAGGLDDRGVGRCVREALRLRVTTCARIQAMLVRAAPRNRPASLAALASRYARLPIARARSDAEAHALELIDAAGHPIPRLNAVIAGEEADLSWPAWRHIVELDGPDFHQFPDLDLAKQAAWERAGWTVMRLPTDDVYDHPERLLAAAEPRSRARSVLRVSS